MPGAGEGLLGHPIGLLDLLEHEIRAHRLQLDRDLRARVVARHDALELVTSFAAEREDEQLLRDGVRRPRERRSPRPAVVQLLVDALDVVGDRRHLADVRELPQLLPRSRSMRCERVRRLAAIRAAPRA